MQSFEDEYFYLYLDVNGLNKVFSKIICCCQQYGKS